MENTDLVQHGWYVGTFLYCLLAGLLPFLSTEAFLLWMAVSAPSHDVLPLLATACFAHMVAKSIVFAAGRGIVGLPRARDHAQLEALQRRMGRGGGSVGLAFLSALTGFPPFYWFSLAAGLLRWSFLRFFAAGLAGRVVRFGLVVLVPQGVDVRGLYQSIGAPNLLIAGLVGLLAGLHASTWAMHRDVAEARFLSRKGLNAVGLGVGLALVWEVLLRFDLAALSSSRLLLFGLTYAALRGVVELHKVFLREGPADPSEPPMPAAGPAPASRLARWAMGAAWVGSLALVAWGVHTVQHRPDLVAPGVAILLVGSLGGWVSAVGAAAKERPGSSRLPLLRSPALALLWSLLVSGFTDQYILIALGSLGFTIATVETVRGLSALARPVPWTRPPLPPAALLYQRRRFAPLFVAIWLVLITHLAWDWSRSLQIAAGL